MAQIQLTITTNNGFLRNGGGISVTVTTSELPPNKQPAPVHFEPNLPPPHQLLGGIAQGETKVFQVELPPGVTDPAKIQTITVAYHPNGGVDEDQWTATLTTAFIPDIIMLPFASRPANFREATPAFEMIPPDGTSFAI